jgi:hypothetical protein
MQARAMERLIDCQGALISALDAGDVTAVEDATFRVARALEAVRAEGLSTNDDKPHFDYALRQAEAARGRVNFLTDRVAQRIERLTQQRGSRVIHTYTNAGKLGRARLA